MMWSEKYRPKSLEEMVGNEEARVMVYDWLMNWKNGMKPLLLVGPPGTGKTTIAYAAARQIGYSVIELNASDTRTKSELSKRLQMIFSTSLTGENRIILLDEVDGLYGRADTGGLEYLVEHLEELPTPVLLAANDTESEQVKKLSKKARLVRMNRIPSRLAELYLRRVLEAEGIALEDDDIRRIVDASKGDMRLLLNTAQMHAEAGSREVPEKEYSYRISDALSLASSANTFDEALNYMQNCDAAPDEKLVSCYYSILAAKIDGERRRSSLKYIAEANLLLKRIRQTQQWRLLRYFDRLLTASIFGARIAGSAFTDTLPFPAKLRIWNDSRHIRAVESLLARATHESTSELAFNHFGYYMIIIARSEGGLERWAHAYNIDQSAINVLQKEFKSIIARVGG